MSNQSSLIYISHTNRPEDGAKWVGFVDDMKIYTKNIVLNGHRITYIKRYLKIITFYIFPSR